ncbi:MAG: histidinol dehydrogenase [Pseudomonadales bacterium]|jgi:histidinol dehydrogenase
MSGVLRRLRAAAPNFQDDLEALLHWELAEDGAVRGRVREIIAEVRAKGDDALLTYTARFDGVEAKSIAELEVPQEALQDAFEALPEAERSALKLARDRIAAYHERQRRDEWRYKDEFGNLLGQLIRPLDRVGLYVPGGQAAYPSSVLMTAVPAKVAGVREVIMTVPTPGGVLNPLVLAAAHLAGVHRVYRVGGAQAIAALAFGTETLSPVDKIVGPGGAYVAEAKRQVFGPVGIDMIAGPSEILVLAEGAQDPHWLAMDLFSQAEHDEAAQAILVSPDPALLDAVEAAVEAALPARPRRAIIEASLRARGALIEVPSLALGVALINRIAPEHLELAVDHPEALLPDIRHAGAIFLGRHTAEVLGDYLAGPSHVLPTFGTARFSSPLGVDDFQKRSSVIGFSPEGAAVLGQSAALLAEGEGLEAHARAAALRVEGFDHNKGP